MSNNTHATLEAAFEAANNAETMTVVFAKDSRVKVNHLKAGYPAWARFLVKPDQRQAGAVGVVVGFYFPDEYHLIAVSHDDGSRGVYEWDELEGTE